MYRIYGLKADFTLAATSPAKLLICMQHEENPLKGEKNIFKVCFWLELSVSGMSYLFLNELLTLFWMHLHQVELGRNWPPERINITDVGLPGKGKKCISNKCNHYGITLQNGKEGSLALPEGQGLSVSVRHHEKAQTEEKFDLFQEN